jgi:hypothetical protein
VCGREFDIPESKLDLVLVTEQWLRDHNALDLETMILEVDK